MDTKLPLSDNFFAIANATLIGALFFKDGKINAIRINYFEKPEPNFDLNENAPLIRRKNNTP
jgi:hypothetical protein